MAPLILLVVLGVAFLLHRIAGRNIELCLLAAVGALTTLLYVAALAGALEPVAVVLFWTGAALGVGLPAHAALRDRGVLRAWLRPGLAFVVACALVHWALFRDARLVFWDELSHWGLVVKELASTHRLYDGTTNVVASSYPPGAGLWQYLTVRNTGVSEAGALFAQLVLLLAPAALLYRGVSWRRPAWCAAIIALQILLYANLGHGTVSLYVDHVLAALVGGAVVGYLSDPDAPATPALLAPLLFLLATIKENGALLAAAVVVFVLGHRGLVRARGRPALPRTPEARRRAVALLALALAPLCAYGSWQLRLDRLGTPSIAGKASLTPGQAARVLLGDAGDDRQRLILDRFETVLWSQQVSKSELSYSYNEFSWGMRERYPDEPRLSAVGFFALALGLLAVRFALAARERGTLAWTAAFVAGLCAANTLLVLLLYVFVIRPEHAVKLPSYVRYVNVGLHPLVLTAFASFLPVCGAFGYRPLRGWGARLGAVVPVLALAALYAVETPYLEPLYRPVPGTGRARLQALAEPLRETLPPEARLLLVSQAPETRFARVVLRYELAPVRSRFSPPDFGSLPEPDSAALLRENDYVFFLSVDAPTAARYRLPLATGARLFRIGGDPGPPVLDPVR